MVRVGLLVVICLWSIGWSLAAPASNHHFLWRVTDAPAPFYLLGSMHALRSSDVPLDPQIDRVIKESKQIYLESTVEPNVQPTSHKLKDAIHYPTGTTLKQKVKPETYAVIKKYLNTRESEYSNVKPWAVAFFMIEAPGMKQFNAALSVDRYVYQKANGRIHVDGLETTDEVINAFSAMSDAESESFLLQSIAYGERAPALMNQTIDAWKIGDVQRMYQLYVPRGKEPSGYWDWVEKRNFVWVPRMETAIRSRVPTLVVAGALHFCGPNSIVTLLQKRGHKVEQL